MIDGQRVLAVVPARAGSKGVPHKNVRQLHGLSLIGWAARILRQLDYLDARIISTDSAEYAAEAGRHGLDAPFLRPAELSGDTATAVDVISHALLAMERQSGKVFDIVLIIEPTSPLRLPDDITRTVTRLIREQRDSVITVSRLDPKWHPKKVLRIADGRLVPMLEDDTPVSNRQQLEHLYWRNGVCYAVTRGCLLDERLIVGRNCAAELIHHVVVNIDAEWEFDWAESLLDRDGADLLEAVSTE